MVRKRHVGLQGEGGKGWCWRDEKRVEVEGGQPAQAGPQ